jgi:hypothetical protein
MKKILPKWGRGLALGLVIAALGAGASAATVLAVQSVGRSVPIRLDGKADDWEGVPRVLDRKSGTELAFQNDARTLYVLAVVGDEESRRSLEASGMSIVGRPRSGRKAARGALFVTRELSADGFIVWRESQGAVLTDDDKAEIRKTPRHAVSVAYAVDEAGNSYGPLRKQSDVFPPDFASAPDGGSMIYEFRIPLAAPDTVPGAIGGEPGREVRVSFAWGGASRKSLSTQAGRETPDSRSGYQSGTGRTWGQEFLDTFDSLSRPSLDTKKFAVAVDVKLAGTV